MIRIGGVVYSSYDDWIEFSLSAARRARFEDLPPRLQCPFPHEGDTFPMTLAPYPGDDPQSVPVWNGVDCDHIFLAARDLWDVRGKFPSESAQFKQGVIA